LQEIIRAVFSRAPALPVPASLPSGPSCGQNGFDQAEAVADLIASNTEASRQAALKNIRAVFHYAPAPARTTHYLFGPDRTGARFFAGRRGFCRPQAVICAHRELQHTTRQLLHSFALGNVIKNGVQAASLANQCGQIHPTQYPAQ